MRITKAVVAAAGAALVLTACGSDTNGSSADSGPTLPEVSASETTEPTEEPSGPERNQRGNIVKQLGEEGGITNSDGEDAFRFAIDAITPDYQCTGQFSEAPENGHFVAIDLRVATGNMDEIGYFMINPNDFKFIGPDGLTFSNVATMATYSCLPDNEQFSSDPLGPGQQYAGRMVFDLPAPTGVLIYRPAITEGGWEWEF